MNKKKPFKLALVQMLVQGGEKEANLSRAEKYIEEAAVHGAEVVLLPECLDLGWTHPSSQNEAEPIPEGKLEIIHRKLNELDIGHHYYDLGDRLNVAETKLGVFGVMICADAFASGQVLSRSLCYMGADVILSPSAWAVSNDARYSNDQPYGEIWRHNYKPVAKEYQVWIAGVSNVGQITAGPWKGRKCIGSSLVFDPDGNEILQGPYGVDAETIIYTEITPLDRPFRGDEWKNRTV